jgi:hypothetical protein
MRQTRGEFSPCRRDSQIADALDVGVTAIEWVKKCALDNIGEAIVRDRPRPQRTSVLDGEGEAKFVALLSCPAPHGRDRWTVREGPGSQSQARHDHGSCLILHPHGGRSRQARGLPHRRARPEPRAPGSIRTSSRTPSMHVACAVHV